MAGALALLDTVLALVGLYLLRRLFLNNLQPVLPLPPGPRGLPVIGNVFNMPKTHEWNTFAEWRHHYGDIMSLTLFGQPLIILNSPQLAVEMLDQKSSIYSDRVPIPFGGEMIGWKNGLVLLPYGERFREYRRFFHRLIGGKTQVQRFHSLVELETRNYLRRVLHEPERFEHHIRHLAGALILKMTYGYEIKESGDPIVHLVQVAVDQFSECTRPGAFLVDIFPFLRHVPSWVYGVSHRQFTSWQNAMNDMVNIPFDFVKRRMEDHTNIPNFISGLLEDENLAGDKQFNIKWSAASMYSGGADTTVSVIHTFFLAMTLYPEAQRRAQEEIDRVIGPDRLPTFADRDALPYVEALVTEVLRWNPVAPLGVPHRLLEDDVHAGYFIPKGSMIIANVWGFLHDPALYEDPLDFEPSRFVPKDGKPTPPDSRDYCFDFGRRICPGMHLADVSVWLACAVTLAAFQITTAIENGKAIVPPVEYTDGLISHPKQFECSIKPRSAQAEALVLSHQSA